ncbi:MAG: tetratricopeptide repeat protein [Arenimonas sp.]|uniref:tetratricopeptide repeat protein n=1 Tax=Arenimonas sp. TaxID=1872635 RepID=UPI0025C43DF4|nr:tetratricopeptide repeat protein [Arenimonas sp.]MBW8367273.1 tetratricopeptide repeat protein [Arenimonas sp.]
MKATHSLKLASLVLLAFCVATPDALAQRNRSGDKKEEREVRYPDATRDDPDGSFSQRLAKPISRMQKAYEADGEEEQVIAAAEEIFVNEKAQPYDRAMAALLAGTAAIGLDDDARAATYLTRAIDENALSNDNHYTAMLSLASVYINSDDFAKADPLIARVIAETKTTDPQVYALQGASFYNNDKFAEAIPALKRAIELKPDAPDDQWLQMLLACYAETDDNAAAIALGEQMQRKSPDDKRALMMLAGIYSNADQIDKAAALLDTARQKGMLSEASDYQRLVSMYFGMDREKDAAAILEEGMAKGIMPADGKNYATLAQAHYFSDNIPAAIAAAQKAAPLATDGEPGLFLAQILGQEDRNAEAKAAAQQALAKGLKNPGNAWMAIARAEYYSDNIAGAQAAYREAAKDPSTKTEAQKALAQISR